MTLAAIVHPAITVSIALTIVAALWWYWYTLARPGVPASRRRIRRLTTMLLLVALPFIVAGLSFISITTHPREFIMVWTLVLVLMVLVMGGAAWDAINSMRMHQRALDREVAEAAKELRDAMREEERDSRDGGSP